MQPFRDMRPVLLSSQQLRRLLATSVQKSLLQSQKASKRRAAEKIGKHRLKQPLLIKFYKIRLKN